MYLAVALDAWFRRVVDRSIADHLRSDLAADALDMATWRRRPEKEHYTLSQPDQPKSPCHNTEPDRKTDVASG